MTDDSMTSQEFTNYLAGQVAAGELKFAAAVHSLMEYYDAWFMSAQAQCANDISAALEKLKADVPTVL